MDGAGSVQGGIHSTSLKACAQRSLKRSGPQEEK